MQPYAWLPQPYTPRMHGVPPTLVNSEPWVGTGNPDGAEAFQPLHDENLTASREDVIEATAKQTAF